MPKPIPFRIIKATRPARIPLAPRTGDRLPKFFGAAQDAEAVLRSLRILLIGAGSVGGNIALNLARIQIKALGIVDPKCFKNESLLTHPITPSEIGKPKASTMARLCARISPRTRVTAFDGPAQLLSLSDVAVADMVILATDNLAAEVVVGQLCLHSGKPLVQASVHGPTLVAQVRFFANRKAQGPCPACGFNQAEWDALNRDARFSCDGFKSGDPTVANGGPSTMSVSCLCSIAADLALTQILRFFLRLGESVTDTVLEYTGYSHRTVVTRLTRKQDCVCDHTAFRAARPPRRLAQCSLRDLARAAGFAKQVQRLSFAVDGMPWVESGACRCGTLHSVQQFVAGRQETTGRCRSCRADIHPSPIHSHHPVPFALLRSVMDQPLRNLGAPAPRTVVVRGAQKAVLFVTDTNPPTTEYEN